MFELCCWTCSGEGHCFGRPCICGGSGLHVDEVAGLRLRVTELEEEVAMLEVALQDESY